MDKWDYEVLCISCREKLDSKMYYFGFGWPRTMTAVTSYKQSSEKTVAFIFQTEEKQPSLSLDPSTNQMYEQEMAHEIIKFNFPTAPLIFLSGLFFFLRMEYANSAWFVLSNEIPVQGDVPLQ